MIMFQVFDRLLYGAVADFLNMSCCGIDNPFAFNVADVGVFAAEAVAVEPTPAVAKLERDGFARVDSVLAPETASELLTFVNAELEKKAAEAASDDGLSATSSFGDFETIDIDLLTLLLPLSK